MSSAGLDQYKLSYQVSPIILTGGVAGDIPGTGMPIISFTDPGSYRAAILSSADVSIGDLARAPATLDDFFAQYIPMAGGTLIDNQIGQYAFANQAVAANAIVTQPLRVSLMMICPVRAAQGYQLKSHTMRALQSTLAQHNNLAGTYTVATPAYTYTNCILTGLRDVSSGESKQAQMAWQWDFIQPLLTLNDAQIAMNNQMQRQTSGLPIPGDPPRVTGVGSNNPTITTALIPAARPLVGAGQ